MTKIYGIHYIAISSLGIEMSRVDKFYDEGEDDLPPIPIEESKCDCGAKHTSFPNHHSDWCTVIKLKLEKDKYKIVGDINSD